MSSREREAKRQRAIKRRIAARVRRRRAEGRNIKRGTHLIVGA